MVLLPGKLLYHVKACTQMVAGGWQVAVVYHGMCIILSPIVYADMRYEHQHNLLLSFLYMC
jgi:hypothetical protein